MEGHCDRHPFEHAADQCGRCGDLYCNECLVYSFGPAKPPFCVPCAVEAAGVRTGASAKPPLSRRERKRLVKERAASLRAAARAEANQTVVDEGQIEAEREESETVPASALGGIEWCV